MAKRRPKKPCHSVTRTHERVRGGCPERAPRPRSDTNSHCHCCPVAWYLAVPTPPLDSVAKPPPDWSSATGE